MGNVRLRVVGDNIPGVCHSAMEGGRKVACRRCPFQTLPSQVGDAYYSPWISVVDDGAGTLTTVVETSRVPLCSLPFGCRPWRLWCELYVLTIGIRLSVRCMSTTGEKY